MVTNKGIDEQEAAHIRRVVSKQFEKDKRLTRQLDEGLLAILKHQSNMLERLIDLEKKYAKHINDLHLDTLRPEPQD